MRTDMDIYVTYSWPQSQLCLECTHSEYIIPNHQSVQPGDVVVRCKINCTKSDGVKCPMFELIDN